MLEIRNLSAMYEDTESVKHVSLSVQPGEIVGIVGESGSGKSTMLKAVLNLFHQKKVVLNGEILFHGENLLKKKPAEMRQLRGNRIAMVFQHPELSMDPLWTIGQTFYESIRVHRKITRAESDAAAKQLLTSLHFEHPDKILASYPFELSGGMCQRVAIAIAAANGPELMLADEPTSALDVTVQLQAIETMMEMRDTFGMAILIVSHNMGVIAKMADKVGVMRQGELVEWGTKDEVLYHPQHEYTKALIEAVPRIRSEK